MPGRSDRRDTLRYRLEVRPDEAEIAAATLWAAGALGVWEQPGALVAWFPAPTGRPASGETIAPVADRPELELPRSVAGGVVEVEADRDWQAEWKATVSVVHAGRFTVVPTWLVEEHRPGPDETVLVLDPGRAFGSGHHATTVLCLELLDELDLDGRTVVDVGCGSGVLAIAAATRGARVGASDIDADAVLVTAENTARNGVEVVAAQGSVGAALDALRAGVADVVVANLVTDTIAALAGDLVAAVADAGVLVASGIAADRRATALDALVGAGLVVTEVRERAGWVALRGHRGAGSPVGRRGVGVATGPVRA